MLLFFSLAGAFALAQFYSTDLAGDRLGQTVHKLDLAWILVGGGDALHMLLQFACQLGRGGVAGSQDDEGFDDLATHLVGAGNDSGLGDRGMFFERAFDLEGANAVAGADDDIVGASHEPEVAVLVLVGAIAGDVPVAANAGVGGFRIAP